VSSLGIMSLSLALTAALYLPVAAAGWPAMTPSREALASIAILAVVCTAAAFLLFAALIGEVGPVRATVITYVNPAVAAVLGVALLGEVLTPAMLLGFALTITGSTLATRRPEMPEAEATAVEVAGVDDGSGRPAEDTDGAPGGARSAGDAETAARP
jgi:drug/metabolite transporter (DMT)-like permease